MIREGVPLIIIIFPVLFKLRCLGFGCYVIGFFLSMTLEAVQSLFLVLLAAKERETAATGKLGGVGRDACLAYCCPH